MKEHKHYELAYRAHRNTSFSPEKRAELHCKSLDSHLTLFESIGASEKSIKKLESLWIDWMHAKGRCISSMITGPARFPVSKAQKANDSEQKKGRAYYDYFEKVKSVIEKENHYKENPTERPINSSDADALDRLKSKVHILEKIQNAMKTCNRIHRKEGKEAAENYIEETRLREHMKSHWRKDCAFASFQLTNNNAEIKRLRGRIIQIERAKQQENESNTLSDGIKYTKDTESMRVFFEFDGKPDSNTREILKSNGFRWTPSKGHWGRKLTPNAERSAAIVSEKLTAN